LSKETKTPTLVQKITFQFERLVVRGPHYQILLIWGVLVLITLIGGALAYLIPAAGIDRFRSAVWWAFLHLSDPGYLGEDRAPAVRLLAIALTILGLGLFVGALIAIITQWLGSVMERLALGLTPIRANDHVVVLGWTNRSLELVASLLDAKGSGRVSKVVMLVDRITPQIIQEIRDRVGAAPTRRGRLILRSGNPRHIEQLTRVDAGHARAIVLPAGDESGWNDVETLRVVANLGNSALSGSGSAPRLAAEILDPTMADVARHTYPADAQIVRSGMVVGRSLGLGVVSPGLSFITADMLDSSRGCTFRVETFPQLEGETIQYAASRFPCAALVGALQNTESQIPNLQFRYDTVLRKDDRLVFVAKVDEDIAPQEVMSVEQVASEPLVDSIPNDVVSRRLLVLGWNGNVPHLLVELQRHRTFEFSVDILAAQDVVARNAVLERTEGLDETRIQHLVDDPASPQTFRGLDLDGYDAVVIVIADDAKSDNLAAYLLLQHALIDVPSKPHIVMETLDAGTAALLEDRSVEVVNSPVLIADMLAGAVTHPALFPVFDSIVRSTFGVIRIVDFDSLVGENREVDLFTLDAEMRRHGVVFVGYQPADLHIGVKIAPDKRDPLIVRRGDRVVFFEPTKQQRR